MKVLQATGGYDGEPFAILADKIIAFYPCVIKRNHADNSREELPGTRVVVNDGTSEGATFVVREAYESIRAKLEAL